MKGKLVFLCLLFISLYTASFAQGRTRNSPPDYFEIKVGDEVNRSVASFGIGRKFYLGRHVSLAPEISVLGTPFFCGTIRLDVDLGGEVRITPYAGMGITPGIAETTILGADLSYRVSTNFILFLDSRIYFVNRNVYSLGSGFLKIDELNRTRPVVLSLGIGF